MCFLSIERYVSKSGFHLFRMLFNLRKKYKLFGYALVSLRIKISLLYHIVLFV
jgi:hypothetical protein